jgi:RND family efflux transporter MFP subunit
MHHRLSVTSLFVAALVAGCHKPSEATDTAPPPVDVAADNVAVVDSGLIESGPSLSGTLTAQRTAQLRAQVAGAIIALPFDEGSSVSAGETVAVIDTAALVEAVRSTRSQLVSAQLAAEVAHRNDDRSQNLHKAGAIADRDAEVAHNQAIAADAAAADAKSKVATAEKQVSNAVMRAPFSGVISTRPASVGDLLQTGNPILTIVDPTDLELDGSVGADALVAIKRNTRVAFSVNGNPGHIFEGAVVRINPAVDSVTRQIKLYISVPNHDRALAAGLFAQGRVTVASTHAVAIPLAALDQKLSEPTVHRLHNGKVESVVVTLGLRDELAERVEVKSGLAVGDTVLVGAALSTPAGTPVRITQADH